MSGIAIASALALGVVGTVSAQATGTATTTTQSSGGFTYNGDTGPGFWGELSADNALCSAGTNQSPINIGHVKVNPKLKPLMLKLEATPISLINNGHAIEMEIETPNTLTLNGDVYTSAQYHFHTLSEHAINGQRGVMELHTVFKSATGKVAVVGMLFRIGHENAFLKSLTSAGLPRHTGDKVTAPTEINLSRGLTSTSEYFTYAGSLTTPPCTEGVTWFVLEDQAQMSTAQFQAFQNILGNDFRPLQNLNGRNVSATVDGDKG